MSSSISSSDPGGAGADGGGAPVWRRFCAWLVGAAAVSIVTFTTAVVVLDPYDTGRLTPFGPQGMADGPPWKVNASRARDPQFDSAVFGNSRAQMLEPARLDALAGGRFVNLAIQGAAPPELERVYETFLSHHPSPRSVVIGLDELWCRPKQERVDRFPYWLYSGSLPEYLRGLIGFDALEHLPRRLAVLYSAPSKARPDGYWDYTPIYLGKTGAEAVQQRMRASAARPVKSANPDNAFPAMATLRAMLDALPATTRAALVWPPTHISHQPAPGSAAAETLGQCKQGLRDIAGAHPNVTFLDWGGKHDRNHDAANFHDETHFIKAVADELTSAVGMALERSSVSR